MDAAGRWEETQKRMELFSLNEKKRLKLKKSLQFEG